MPDASPQDVHYIRRAIALAANGWGRVAPNPMVGCVIVRDGEVVGEGWHTEYGRPHAEVEALRAAGDRARGATAYVSLEPCSHWGKTPPCTDALTAAGVRRVVYAGSSSAYGDTPTLPKIETAHTVTPSPVNPLGVKGVGELGRRPAGGAVGAGHDDLAVGLGTGAGVALHHQHRVVAHLLFGHQGVVAHGQAQRGHQPDAVIRLVADVAGVVLQLAGLEPLAREDAEHAAIPFLEFLVAISDPPGIARTLGAIHPVQQQQDRRPPAGPMRRHGGAAREPPQLADLHERLQTLHVNRPGLRGQRTAGGDASALRASARDRFPHPCVVAEGRVVPCRVSLGGHRAQFMTALDSALREASLHQEEVASGQVSMFGAPATSGTASWPLASHGVRTTAKT